MRIFLIVCALAALVVAGALFLVERRLRARTSRVLAALAPADGERVIEARARVQTAFADGMPF